MCDSFKILQLIIVEKILLAGHHHGAPYHNLDEKSSKDDESKYGTLEEGVHSRI